MRAVVISRHGGPEVLEVRSVPTRRSGPGEMRIAVTRRGDQLRRPDGPLRASTPTRRSHPAIIGYEVAGEVESVGEGVQSVRPVGDRVLAGTRFGGYAELVSVPSPSRCCRCPTRSRFEQGAAFPVNYGDRLRGAVIMGGLRQGDRLLIHAAAGGVGIAATQIATEHRRRGLRHRVGGQARRDPLAGRRSPDRLPHAGLRGRGHADHRRRGRGRRHGRDRALELPQELPVPAPGRPAGDVRALRGPDGRAARHPGGAEGPGADAPGDDAVVEEPVDDEREQGRLRPQHALLVGPGGGHRAAWSSR